MEPKTSFRDHPRARGMLASGSTRHGTGSPPPATRMSSCPTSGLIPPLPLEELRVQESCRRGASESYTPASPTRVTLRAPRASLTSSRSNGTIEDESNSPRRKQLQQQTQGTPTSMTFRTPRNIEDEINSPMRKQHALMGRASTNLLSTTQEDLAQQSEERSPTPTRTSHICVSSHAAGSPQGSACPVSAQFHFETQSGAETIAELQRPVELQGHMCKDAIRQQFGFRTEMEDELAGQWSQVLQHVNAERARFEHEVKMQMLAMQREVRSEIQEATMGIEELSIAFTALRSEIAQDTDDHPSRYNAPLEGFDSIMTQKLKQVVTRLKEINAEGEPDELKSEEHAEELNVQHGRISEIDEMLSPLLNRVEEKQQRFELALKQESRMRSIADEHIVASMQTLFRDEKNRVLLDQQACEQLLAAQLSLEVQQLKSGLLREVQHRHTGLLASVNTTLEAHRSEMQRALDMHERVLRIELDSGIAQSSRQANLAASSCRARDHSPPRATERETENSATCRRPGSTGQSPIMPSSPKSTSRRSSKAQGMEPVEAKPLQGSPRRSGGCTSGSSFKGFATSPS